MRAVANPTSQPLSSDVSGVDRAERYVAEQIALGLLKPGDRIVEAQVARVLDISRTPVREALARLRADGVVESRHNQGAEVARMTRAEIDDLFQIRLVLEGYGARMAAKNITLDELSQAGNLIDQIDDARLDPARTHTDRARTVAVLNSKLHHLIAGASRNRILPGMIGRTVRSPLSFTMFLWYTEQELAHSNDEHRTLLASLTARDPDAAEQAMLAHVRSGLNVLLRGLET